MISPATCRCRRFGHSATSKVAGVITQTKWCEEVVHEYRRRDLPLDVIHLDIDYMQGYRVFTWDRERFPNPKALSEKLDKARRQANHDR